ncbi:MAG: DUF4198 domain-containing protein [Zoogloea sp.]|nr:DUF4198 domain-containing protein [Zoogloea sp.]
MRSKTLILAAALAGLVPFCAQAHRTWLLPSSSVVEGKEPWVTVDAAVSENLFDFDSNAAKLDGLVVTGPDGNPVTPENRFAGRLRSSFDLKLARPGTYKISIAGESVMASYKLNGEARRWRGTPEEFATAIPAGAEDVRSSRMHSRMETFVTAGAPNDVALKSSGVGLELVPITHPTELMAGEKASFRFLLDGKPAANLAVSVVPGGVRYRGVLKEISLATDAKGEFSVAWPEAGMYWISASFPPRAAQPAGPQVQGGGQPERRVSYSGTLEVLPQ